MAVLFAAYPKNSTARSQMIPQAQLEVPRQSVFMVQSLPISCFACRVVWCCSYMSQNAPSEFHFHHYGLPPGPRICFDDSDDVLVAISLTAWWLFSFCSTYSCIKDLFVPPAPSMLIQKSFSSVFFILEPCYGLGRSSSAWQPFSRVLCEDFWHFVILISFTIATLVQPRLPQGVSRIIETLTTSKLASGYAGRCWRLGTSQLPTQTMDFFFSIHTSNSTCFHASRASCFTRFITFILSCFMVSCFGASPQGRKIQFCFVQVGLVSGKVSKRTRHWCVTSLQDTLLWTSVACMWSPSSVCGFPRHFPFFGMGCWLSVSASLPLDRPLPPLFCSCFHPVDNLVDLLQ